MGYYKQLDIDRQNWDGYWNQVDSREGRQDWAAIQAECEAIDKLMSPSKHRVTKIVTGDDGSVLEIHQQLVPRFIVLLSMAMTFCLAIAVFVLVSILLLGV
tara:strand:+ start:267 stop:569 length:303 start_codon:yes stop_codon:yes gene_type:complete